MRTIHLLNWDLKSIEEMLPLIKEQGFDSIQINPMQPFKEENDFHWYMSYQPLGFRIGNMFGTKEDLKRLCQKANEMGIGIIVDVICNHMANKSDKEALIPHETVDKELLDRKDFWKPRIMMKDGDDRYDATHHLIGLPGLDLSNPDLKKIVFRYLDELRECGVKGYRFDAAKHIGLPPEGVTFFPEVKEYIDKYDMVAYGEFLGGDKAWRDEFAQYLPILSSFSCTNSEDKERMVFFESHDTFLNNDGHSTRNITTNQLIRMYPLLTALHENTIIYVRPKNAPYHPFKRDTGVMEAPKYTFELDILTSPDIKAANEQNKDIELEKSSGKVLSKTRKITA